MGYPVGIIANNGILFSESALKAAHFIELCCQRKMPLIFLQNITGFMVGKQYEARRHRQGRREDGDGRRQRRRAEVHRDRRRLVRRRQLRHVRPRLRAAPALDVAQRAHLGDGRRAGRQHAADRAHGRAGGARQEDVARSEQEEFKAPILAKYEEEGSPYYSTARLWDDGIIDPLDTRTALGLGIAAALNTPDPRDAPSASSGCSLRC